MRIRYSAVGPHSRGADLRVGKKSDTVISGPVSPCHVSSEVHSHIDSRQERGIRISTTESTGEYPNTQECWASITNGIESLIVEDS